MVYFITSNKKKFAEAKAIIPELEQLDIELPEIQHIDPKKVVKDKLKEAIKHADEVVVEDTSLHMSCLKGLPGPLIKWFLQTVGSEGLFHIADSMGDYEAEGKSIVGYAKGDRMEFFEGSIKGKIVEPRVKSGFGWDLVFQPDGQDLTFAEMASEEKNKISHRRKSMDKLKSFIK